MEILCANGETQILGRIPKLTLVIEVELELESGSSDSCLLLIIVIHFPFLHYALCQKLYRL